jgi:hypothetical protein
MEMQTLIPWAFAGIFAVMGLLIAGVGLGRVVRRKHLRRRGFFATGTVVAIRETPSDDGATYAPVVAFTTDQGKAEITGQFCSPCFYRVGERVRVCYPPEKPARGVILNRREAMIAWGLLVVGLVMLGIGAVLALVSLVE